MPGDDEYFLEKLEEATFFMVKESVSIEKRIEGFALVLSPLIVKRYQHASSEINDLWNPIMKDLVSDGEIINSLRAKNALEPKKLNEMEKAIFKLAQTAKAFKEGKSRDS